jgi:hypothetical protein
MFNIRMIQAVSLTALLSFPAVAQDQVFQENQIQEREVIDPFLQENQVNTLSLEDLADPMFGQMPSNDGNFDPAFQEENEPPFESSDDTNIAQDSVIDEGVFQDDRPFDELTPEEQDRLLGNEPPQGGYAPETSDGLDNIESQPLDNAAISDEPPADYEAPEGRMVDGASAILRGLDTLNGTVRDFTIAVGQTLEFERLRVTLFACRYPEGDIDGDAYAFLKIRDKRETNDRFSGWMLASSPALSSLDHPRYDIWVLSCKTS